MKRRIIYHVPTSEVLEDYAYQVCREHGKEYTHHEIVRGFTNFVKVVAAINVKITNKQQEQSLDKTA